MVSQGEQHGMYRTFLFSLAFSLWAVAEPPRLSGSELEQVLERPEVFLLDVRTPEEVERLGSPQGSVNIPIDELETRLEELPRDRMILTL